ncbi:hypothetical protein [Nocardioides bizhenqiangii]|uniref:Lipoprotein n=1 Tax=Nocardioides bizhenqiangii TaxID=3095076 RepID=A0ABZ0ZQK3_9ACTN|nr:hypothetical protein [Nocardioides sp. HM61]WQQ26056.1 hypothetical protein SHK19_19085 [Nocardioides sp. HM61]
MRARAVIGSIVLVLSAALAACGEEQDTIKAGDLIQASADDQFKDGKEATVTLPTGRLLIHTAEPVDSATGDDTRTRQAVDAPSGAVLVPISWQYDPWDQGRLERIVDSSDTPIVDLVTDEERYRLPPPELGDEGGESFYVVVDGEAEDRSLEIEFDGVTQSVNLANGRTDAGDAAALYDIRDDALQKASCDDDERWFDSVTVSAEFTCDRFGPVLTPYAAGEWAPEGSLWLALTVQTEMRIYAEANLLGGGARFVATDVTVKPDIDGDEPTFVISADNDDDTCPSPLTTACGWSKTLIFEVPADDAEQGPLDLDVAYRMKVAIAWGGHIPPKRMKVEASEEIKLWDD